MQKLYQCRMRPKTHGDPTETMVTSKEFGKTETGKRRARSW